MSIEQLRCAIRRLTQRLGYGSAQARLWICGIEEHGGGSGAFDDAWVLAQAEKSVDGAAYPAFSDGHGTSAAWRYSFELAAFAHAMPAAEFGKEWVKRPDLLQLTNLLVLPKRRVSDWKLTAISRVEYLKIIDGSRVPFLRSARPDGCVVVCHGQRHRALLQKAFVDSDEQPLVIEGSRGKHTYIYPRSRTVLAPFFVPHQLPSREFETLKKAVHDLLVGAAGVNPRNDERMRGEERYTGDQHHRDHASSGDRQRDWNWSRRRTQHE